MIEIDSIPIGKNHKPYIIAELSANHGGSIDAAKEAIISAKKCGASAVKIQSYTPETITLNSDKPDFIIKEGIWSGYTLHDLYTKAHTPFEWHAELFKFAADINITIFSSPFDDTAIDLLMSLDAPAYKIASFEIVDLALIKRAAECKKPLLISTGMASLEEISEALNVAIKYGSGDVMLLHCVSSYPAKTSEYQLNNISFLKSEFGVEVGLSDHSLSNIAAVTSIGLGAVAIEKHFKLSDKSESLDASFSLEPKKFITLVEDCNEAWKAKGTADFNRPKIERVALSHRRSLYFTKDLRSGSVITENDIKSIRPGYGVKPKFLEFFLGEKLNTNVERGDPVSFEIINKKFQSQVVK